MMRGSDMLRILRNSESQNYRPLFLGVVSVRLRSIGRHFSRPYADLPRPGACIFKRRSYPTVFGFSNGATQAADWSRFDHIDTLQEGQHRRDVADSRYSQKLRAMDPN